LYLNDAKNISMKKISFLRNTFFSIVTIFICSVSFAQTKPQPITEQDVLTLLCHKWEYKEYISDGMKLPYPRKWIDAYLLFKSDGTIIKRENDEDFVGKWSYSHKRLTITIEFKEGKERLRIKNISDTEFMFHSYDDPANFNIKMLRL
jgi:hypothetical protein